MTHIYLLPSHIKRVTFRYRLKRPPYPLFWSFTMLISRLSRYLHTAVVLIPLCVTGNCLAAAQPAQNSTNFGEINFSEIREFAGFANAAYQTSPQIREFSQSRHYELTRYQTIPEIQIACFVATNNATKTQIIAIRGTSNVENAIVDIALKLTRDSLIDVRLHEGFSTAARAIYTEIKSQLKTDYVINTTGHSLGGAVAMILAMYLDNDHFRVGQVVTFGQPKVTNISGANKFDHLKVTRVVAPKDLVPLVPLFDPMDINNLDIYWHTGRELILYPDTGYAVLAGIESMLRATKFTQEPLNEENLKNHQMTLYLAMLDAKIPVARLVPYKNSFNLFNLFGS